MLLSCGLWDLAIYLHQGYTSILSVGNDNTRDLPVSTSALLTFLKPQDVSGNYIIIIMNNHKRGAPIATTRITQTVSDLLKES